MGDKETETNILAADWGSGGAHACERKEDVCFGPKGKERGNGYAVISGSFGVLGHCHNLVNFI